MNDDRNGIVDDPRTGQQSENEKASPGIAKANEGCVSSTEDDCCVEEQAVPEELIDREALREITQCVEVLAEYEGPLPLAKDFNEYNEKGQDTIREIALMQMKAIFVDESARADKLTAAEIKQGYIGQALSAAICLAAIGASTALGICTESSFVAAVPMALPFGIVISGLFKPTDSRNRK